MAKKKNWLANELMYLLLAPLMVMVGVLLLGVLFDDWHKDVDLLIKSSGMAYVAILFLRLFMWIYRQFN